MDGLMSQYTFLSCLTCVLVPFFCMLCVAAKGVFNSVELDLDLEDFAEPAWFSYCSFMPLNTLVNFVYLAVGIYWCYFTRIANIQGVLKHRETLLFYTFNIMACLYSGVQLMRLLTHSVLWAVLDQWCTLPFFAYVLVWGLYFWNGWSATRCAVIITVSILTYTLSLISVIGFEICLGVHIFGALSGGIMAYQKHPSEGSLVSIGKALLSCLGFVVLKLLDHKLPGVFWGFRYISGHFLSKICDVLQIFYVNDFFLDITLQKAADLSVEEKLRFFQDCEREKRLQKLKSCDILYEIPPLQKKAQ